VSPWERRERGGLYYTRSRRVNGQVVREYVGSGLLGQLAARLDAEERRLREEEQARRREERERLDALVASVEELCEASDLLVKAVLLASGYHQHKRGEWRKRREPKTP
jgi:hypothetical protein